MWTSILNLISSIFLTICFFESCFKSFILHCFSLKELNIGNYSTKENVRHQHLIIILRIYDIIHFIGKGIYYILLGMIYTLHIKGSAIYECYQRYILSKE